MPKATQRIRKGFEKSIQNSANLSLAISYVFMCSCGCLWIILTVFDGLEYHWMVLIRFGIVCSGGEWGPLQNPKHGLKTSDASTKSKTWGKKRGGHPKLEQVGILYRPSLAFNPCLGFCSGQSGAKNSKNITEGRAKQWRRIQLMYFIVSLCVLSFFLVSVVILWLSLVDFGWFKILRMTHWAF